MKIDIIKKEKGAISTLVLFTVLMFTVILMGVFLSITTRQKGQLKSDMRIIDIYGRDVEIVDEVYNEIPKVKLSDLKAGDYIKYDTGVDGVGEIMCRVLYEASSEYGLQIISDKTIKETVDGVIKVRGITLGGSDWETGKTSYNRAIKTLNDVAVEYLNRNYAADARCVGSLPTVDESGIFTQKDSGAETTVSIPLDWELPNGWTSTDTGCYDTDTNNTEDENAMKAVGILKTGEIYDYWLASRYRSSYSSLYGFCVDIMDVDEGRTLTSSYLCQVKSDGSTYGGTPTWYFRPCFSLKSNIKITGGDGTTEDTAYTLGI